MLWGKVSIKSGLIFCLCVVVQFYTSDVVRAAVLEGSLSYQMNPTGFEASKNSENQPGFPLVQQGTVTRNETEDTVIKIVHCCHAHPRYPYDRYCCHSSARHYVPRYYVGPRSVRGVSRRTARRTSRRVSRRRR